jgi:hypothetical protein
LSKKRVVWLGGGMVLWVIWCVFVVLELVPVVLRRITIYNQLAAWILCMIPPTAAAVVAIVRLSREEGN